jgi:hypothetical protein
MSSQFARIENVVVTVGFVADAKCGLLNLIQLVDDRAPHFLRLQLGPFLLKEAAEVLG